MRHIGLKKHQMDVVGMIYQIIIYIQQVLFNLIIDCMLISNLDVDWPPWYCNIPKLRCININMETISGFNWL